MARRSQAAGDSARRWAVVAGVGVVAALVLMSMPAIALDGNLLFRDNRQAGRISDESYDSHTQRFQGTAGQRIPLGRRFGLRADGRYLDERSSSRLGDTGETTFDQLTRSASLTFDYRGRTFRFGLFGSGSRRETDASGAAGRNIEREQLAWTSSLRSVSWLRLSSNASYSNSRRREAGRAELRRREWTGTLGSRADVPRVGELGYRMSGLINENLTRDSRFKSLTQTLSFAGESRFAGDRGVTSVDARSSFFTQRIDQTISASGERIRLPLTGGFLLDDSPEVLDPLEDPLTSVPDLWDRDRTTPTIINIGDSAPPVRDFGGDYRNIAFDFGEDVEIVSATLYIDETLLNPEFFRWRVFTSDDPDGRIWDEVGSGRVSVAYEEWDTGQQGWTVTFADPATARFFKMVDEKLGPTLPDLFVTELETVVLEPEVSSSGSSSSANHRLNGTLDYALARNLWLGYDLLLRRRTFSDSEGSVDGVTHGFDARWRRDAWTVTGRYELQTLDSRGVRTTDVDVQSLGVRRGRANELTVDMTWQRTHDRSERRSRTTNDAALGIWWRAAPRLSILHRLSFGWLDDRAIDQDSRSATVLTTVHGRPVPSLSLDLAHTNRWVTEEAGSGFTRFDDTSVAVIWSPLPLISFRSFVRHQYRDRSDWITRQTVSWSPLAGGTLEPRFKGSYQHDTRVDTSQRAASASLRWRVRPTLTLDGTIEASAFEEHSRTNTPVNTELRAIWRF